MSKKIIKIKCHCNSECEADILKISQPQSEEIKASDVEDSILKSALDSALSEEKQEITEETKKSWTKEWCDKNLPQEHIEITEEEYNTQIKYIRAKDFKLPIAKWVEYKDLSKDEQTTTAKQLGGLLKTLFYKDAWKEMWSTLSQEDKNFFKNLPHFNKEIFTSITGIEDIEEVVEEMTLKMVCEKLGKNIKIIK